MRRLLIVAALPLLILGGCVNPKDKPTPPFHGRWVSSSVKESPSRIVTLRLDPDGKFFGIDINTNTGMQYTMAGTWIKVDPLVLKLTTDDKLETYTLTLDEKNPSSTLTGTAITATLERAE
jgi:hypothetical protein